jgi:hypothetical protein
LRSGSGTMPGQRFYPNGVASTALEFDFRQFKRDATASR